MIGSKSSFDFFLWGPATKSEEGLFARVKRKENSQHGRHRPSRSHVFVLTLGAAVAVVAVAAAATAPVEPLLLHVLLGGSLRPPRAASLEVVGRGGRGGVGRRSGAIDDGRRLFDVRLSAVAEDGVCKKEWTSW